VQEVEKTFQGRMKKAGISLHVSEDLPIIQADREKIYLVFQNLIGNAIKFSKGASPPTIEVGYEDRDTHHRFYVKDHGIGVPRENQEKIFDKFVRLKKFEDDEGTGLGLAIVKKIVSAHGGKVWVQSEKNHGATFFFTVPK
jgi:signal transduction histidine kinase